MTSANVFNLNSVKQGQVLNANAAKGRSKAENPDAAGVFASLMGSNYSTNFNMPSVNTKINNNVLQQTNAADNYDRYQYQDNTIRQAARDVVTDVIDNSTDTLDQFQGDVVRTVAEQLGVSEDSVKDMMESLGLTAFDLLNPENLAQLAMQLTGETSPMDLLMNDQFQGLMQQMDQLGGQLANELNLQPAQMEELIAQMDILQTPETLTDEEMQVLTDVAGQQTTADTVSADVMPELAQTDEVQPMDKQADVFQKESKSDEVRTQQPQTKQTAEQQTMEQQTDAGDADSQTGDQVKSAQPEKMTADAGYRRGTDDGACGGCNIRDIVYFCGYHGFAGTGGRADPCECFARNFIDGDAAESGKSRESVCKYFFERRHDPCTAGSF